MQLANRATSTSSAWVLVRQGKKKMLLGKRSRKVSNGGQWGLFGGTVDENEDPAKGAARELKEETGLRVKPNRLKLLWRGKHPGDKRHSYYFLWDMGKKNDRVKINWETDKTGWFSVKGAKNIKNKHFSLADLVKKLKAKGFSGWLGKDN